MTRDPSIPPSLGDPLLSVSNPAATPSFDDDVIRSGSTRTRPTRSTRGGRSTRRSIGPGPRLALAVAVVLGATVVVAQRGGNSSPTDGAAAGIASGKTVLVSDPANLAIVREIAGDLLQLDSVVPPGANGHTYEPVPADAMRVAIADLYIENGMGLNDAVSAFVRANYRSGTPDIRLSDSIPSNEVISTDSAEQIAAHGHAHSFNAHFWTDPNYVILYAERISIALSSLDPANATTYAANASDFIERLRAMDEVFRAAIASIPITNRKLVVYHDSWSYFGRRYGIPIVGAIQPVSFAEPSADEIRKMVDQIRAERVPAFFGSEVFPSDVLNALAAETGARYYSDLSDEELPGEPGSPEHSYEGMMIQNVRLITSALGGNVSLLDTLSPGVNRS